MGRRGLILVLVLVLAPMAGCINTGEGSHVGHVTAVEKVGYIWKTWKVYFKTDLESTQEDIYCVPPDLPRTSGLIAQLEDAASNNDRVRIHYHGEAVTAPWRCDAGEAIIDAVEVVG